MCVRCPLVVARFSISVFGTRRTEINATPPTISLCLFVFVLAFCNRTGSVVLASRLSCFSFSFLSFLFFIRGLLPSFPSRSRVSIPCINTNSIYISISIHLAAAKLSQQ